MSQINSHIAREATGDEIFLERVVRNLSLYDSYIRLDEQEEKGTNPQEIPAPKSLAARITIGIGLFVIISFVVIQWSAVYAVSTGQANWFWIGMAASLTNSVNSLIDWMCLWLVLAIVTQKWVVPKYYPQYLHPRMKQQGVLVKKNTWRLCIFFTLVLVYGITARYTDRVWVEYQRSNRELKQTLTDIPQN